MSTLIRFWVWLLLIAATPAVAQVTYERLLNAEKEPGNWMTYSGNYSGWRYSPLKEINRDNAHRLRLRWVHQMRNSQVETTPLVVDGVMYLTEPPNDVAALDPETGRLFWRYRRALPTDTIACCGDINRGLAMYGDKLYLSTLDAKLVALDAKTGDVIWEVEVANYKEGHAKTGAPLVVKDMIVTGIAGGEYGIRGFLDAYDAETGERRWRFYTIPEPGEPGNESWAGDSWKTGGAPTWVTGSFDPELNLIIWGTGNPAPDWNGDKRAGDNLYADSAIALDADTGKLRWAFQFVPHDVHDWDAVQVPILVDAEWDGQPRKLVYWAHRGGFYYVLDRTSGQFLLGTPFAKQTWAKGLDENGRPIRMPGIDPTDDGVIVWPSALGATNWFSPSYSPETGLFYVAAWDGPGLYRKGDDNYEAGQSFTGGGQKSTLEDDPGSGAIRALNAKTGELVWELALVSKPMNGFSRPARSWSSPEAPKAISTRSTVRPAKSYGAFYSEARGSAGSAAAQRSTPRRSAT